MKKMNNQMYKTNIITRFNSNKILSKNNKKLPNN